MTFFPARAAEQPVWPPYQYPFSEAELVQGLRETPMMIELFTSLDCLFCPRAEKILNDLAARSAAIVSVCHVDPEGQAYPLGREFCAARQERYGARLSDGLLYTPQLIVNGRLEAVGHEFSDVEQALRQALTNPPVLIKTRVSDQPEIIFADLPAIQIKGGADLFMVMYHPPYTVPATMRQSTTRPDPLTHVASRIFPMGAYNGQARTLSIPFAPSNEAVGFIVLLQGDDNQIWAVGQWPNPHGQWASPQLSPTP